MKAAIWLVDIALGFCIAANEIGSWIIHKYKGFQMNWPTDDGGGMSVIKRGLLIIQISLLFIEDHMV